MKCEVLTNVKMSIPALKIMEDQHDVCSYVRTDSLYVNRTKEACVDAYTVCCQGSVSSFRYRLHCPLEFKNYEVRVAYNDTQCV
jgi:hypothetical protein